MSSVLLKLKFKGNRNYLHGSDIYNTVVRELSLRNGGRLKRLAFRSFSRTQVLLCWDTPGEGSIKVGQGQWIADSGSEFPFWIIETQVSIIEAYAFDEPSIVSKASIRDETLICDYHLGYSPIENIIALTKRLAYHLMPVSSGKWIFGQLDLEADIDRDFRSIVIERQGHIANRFMRCSIHLDGAFVGNIRFILGNP
ncbi:hypothetical protein R0137_17065 [Congregibacter brevis]|uniref:Uncharacterized protein n=1 Tax=Congregibacter brevis TaxID=3081201 RepID=A0ABZ0IFZ5_9GAMM|nr:hypothetical protein R0137_17065 [Congregibacter sp. IMCC45268]